MSLVQLYIPSEVAHDTISELAEMSNFQFKDVGMNPHERMHNLTRHSSTLRLLPSNDLLLHDYVVSPRWLDVFVSSARNSHLSPLLLEFLHLQPSHRLPP